MQWKKQIQAIAFSVLLLVSVISFMPFQTANATTISKITTGSNRNVIDIQYQSNTGILWALVADPTGNALTKAYLQEINPSTNTILNSFNVTQSTTLTAQGLWCGQTDCFVAFTVSGNTNGRVIKVSSITVAPTNKGDITGTYNTPAGLGIQRIQGRDVVTGGFGSITIWLGVKQGSNANIFLYILDGISMTATYNTIIFNGTGDIYDMEWSQVAGTTDNHLIISGILGAQYEIKIFNLATLAFVCSSNNNANVLTAIYPDYTNNVIMVGHNGGTLEKYNKSCTDVGTIATATTGLSQDIRGLIYLPLKGKWYAQESGINAYISELPYSAGTFSTNTGLQSPFPSTSQNAYLGNFAYDGTHDKLFMPYSGSDNAILIISFGIGSGTGASACVDTNADGIADVCYTDTNGDGVPDVPTVLVLARQGQNVSQIADTFGCGLGLSDCNNHDVKTNGVGYIMLIILLVLVITLMAVGTRGKLGQIPPAVWVIILITVTGASYFLKWNDGIPFYMSIVAIIAFGAFKIVQEIQSRASNA